MVMVFYREKMEIKISHKRMLRGQSWGKAPHMGLQVVPLSSQDSKASPTLMCDHFTANLGTLVLSVYQAPSLSHD